ncbi:MAG: twin-arginine translocase TatA/TatE family subunit [Ilumatobacteraceae bacterium]
MFNFSSSEMVFLLLLALIILGPEKLPDAVRKFGQTYGELKKAATGFQSELKSALDEPMKEMRSTADELKKAASFDVMSGFTPDPKPSVAPTEPAGDAPPTLSPFESADASSAAPPIRPTPLLLPEAHEVPEVVASDDLMPAVTLPAVTDEVTLAAADTVVPEPSEPAIPEPVIPEPVIPEPVIPEPVIPTPMIPTPMLPPLKRVLAARPPAARSSHPADIAAPAAVVRDAPAFAAPAWPQPVADATEPAPDPEVVGDEGPSPA